MNDQKHSEAREAATIEYLTSDVSAYGAKVFEAGFDAGVKAEREMIEKMVDGLTKSVPFRAADTTSYKEGRDDGWNSAISMILRRLKEATNG